MKILIAILALTLSSLCVDQLYFTIQVKTNSSILFTNNITIYYHQILPISSIHLQIPKEQLTQAYIQVSIIEPSNSTPAQTKSYKLTKKMFAARQNYGLQKWFGIDNIVISNEIDVEEVYPQKIYLKVAYHNSLKERWRMNINNIPFTIDQSLILSYKQFKRVSSINGNDTVRLAVCPELFQSDFFYSSKLVSKMSEYHKYFQGYFISSRNKKMCEQDIRMIKQLNKFYKDSLLQSLQQLQSYKQSPHNRLNQEMAKLLKIQINEIDRNVEYFQSIEEIVYKSQYNHIFTLVKNITLNILFQFLQILKKCIFFNNYYEYYEIVISIGIFSIIASNIACIIFLLSMIYNKFNNYQEHRGITLISCYLIIALELIRSFSTQEIGFTSVVFILLFMEPIMRLQFQKISSFPFFKQKTHACYEKINAYDSVIGIIIGLTSLGILIGNYFFFARKVKYSSQTSLDKFNPFQILTIILKDYLYFFFGLAQIYVNQQLQSVRHLTKGYIIVYTIIALSDNFWAFIYNEPFYVLFILKEDVLAAILIWQCIKWEDIGESSRKYEQKKFIDAELAKRQAELLALC